MKVSVAIVSLIISTSCGDFFDEPGASRPMNFSNQKLKTLYVIGELSTSQSEWVSTLADDEDGTYFSFQDYSQVDSIIFKASLRSQQENVRCVAELFNIASGEEVVGSQVFSKIRYQLHSVRTRDIKYSLPHYSVRLGVRIKSELNSNYVEGRNFLVLIYYR